MAEPPQTVEWVDLERYAGLWYEIARLPNRFQRRCDAHVTAHYALRKDGRIAVTNRCRREDGSTDEAAGVARVRDPVTNARLQVSFVSVFGYRLFWGDYWIIGLDDRYQYAIVGHPTRKYGWILSRTPELPGQQLDELFTQLRQQGYDPEEFEMTSQSAAGSR